jgi:hypothetical protein
MRLPCDVSDVFMIVDEKTGEVHEPEGLAGTWLLMSPDGRRLCVGEKQYRFGSSHDSLITYDIRQTMRPYLRNIKYEPGANGSLLYISRLLFRRGASAGSEYVPGEGEVVHAL